MNGKPGAIVHKTILDQHVMGNAPDDAVAVEIAHGHLTDDDAITFIQANAAIVKHSFIKHLIVSLVAIQSDVLDHDVRDAGALEQRKIGSDFRVAYEVETLTQAAIEFEAITRRGDQRSLNEVGALAVGIPAD
jgi:hypothetical protein